MMPALDAIRERACDANSKSSARTWSRQEPQVRVNVVYGFVDETDSSRARLMAEIKEELQTRWASCRFGCCGSGAPAS